MTKNFFGAVAVSTLALTVLSGCANITDQIAKQMAEGAINQATGGKVTMTDSNGNFVIKDDEGNEATIGGGDQRPSTVPADMPSLPGAKDFGWFGGKDGGIFTFTTATADYKTACDQMVTMVKAAGWAEDETGFNMEVEGSKTTLYKKTGYALTLTCATSEGDKMTSITQTKSKTETTTTTSS